MPPRRGKRIPSVLKRRSIGASFTGRVHTAMALPTLAGPAINEQTALSITAVYNAVTLISNAYACLETGVAERTQGNGRRLAREMPLYDLLAKKPSNNRTSFNHRRSQMGHALTAGNGYSEIEFRRGIPVALHLLDPKNTDPRITDGGKLYYYLIREKKDLPAESVIHVANWGWDGIKGYSPITLARETLGLAKAQEVHQSGLMGNSAVPSGFIEYPGKIKEIDKNRLRLDHESMHRGAEQAGTLGILDGGAKWVSTAFSPADAELLLSRAFSVAEVARLFGIPQHLIGLLEHATFSNIEQQLIEFHTFTLLPWLINIENEMDTKFFSRIERQNYFVYHDIKTLLRADTATRTAQETSDFKIGVKSQNEIRADRGENPIDHPNAEKHYIEANNMFAIEDMKESAKEKPEPPDLVLDPGEEPERSLPMSREDVFDLAIEAIAA